MNKNDKIIAVIGVLILVIASIGVYTWVPSEAMADVSSINEFFQVTSSLLDIPDAITVSDTDPFYALIATPLAVHYGREGMQEILPLYVKNLDDPSRAVERVGTQINSRIEKLTVDNSQCAKNVSLDFAKMYWENSEAVLLIEYNESGYNLGVIATPLASYLTIPVIVTDELDHSVRAVLSDLGVKKTFVCGNNIDGYGSYLRFTSVEEIVDATISLLIEKFGKIDYLTITNPLDVWPPEVLDSTEIILGPETFSTSASTEFRLMLKGGSKVLGTFKIPEDYKYALVKFRGINLNMDDVNELGDSVTFSIGPMLDDLPSTLQRFEILAGGTASGGIPERDSNGNILVDQCYNEAVLYRRGGVEYQVTANPRLLATDQGDVRAEITIEKLSDPYYEMMKGLSSIAPYLTAYHKGLIFGKPEFAFAATDDVLYMGEPSPGFYMPRRNPRLAPASNEHVFEIHNEINELLAKLAGITIEKDIDIKNLRDHYKNNPIYVTLVGGATVLPQYYYATSIEPLLPPEDVKYYWGGGVPSDFMYGNIDPKPGEWQAPVPDLYSDAPDYFPYQENIVGRITGWDVQDASALIVRTIFYNEIIDELGDWKDNAVLQMGGGNDFQEPLLRYNILKILGLTHGDEPMKLSTGASYFNGLALQKNIESLGFETEYARENVATYQGFSNEAIDKLKKANLLNKLLLSKRQLKNAVGVDVVQGKELQENSNFILANAHGNMHLFTMGDVGIYKLGLGRPGGFIERRWARWAPILGVGPGMSLGDHGNYHTRNVENMNLGPSFLWIESCICGKIDGVYPKQGISQSFLHAGCNAVIAATTTSNVPGGYIEPKNSRYDLPWKTLTSYIRASRNVKKGIYPEQHFGFKIYSDLLEEIKEEDMSIGFAYREARNRYLPEEADWLVWWSPPLITTGDSELDAEIFGDMASTAKQGLDPRMDNKYQSFFEYTLYGDPAFIPYVPFDE